MAATNRILAKMLDRLFAALTSGPSLNARPHSSRQRVDVMSLAKLGDVAPREALRQILGEERGTKLRAKIDPPKTRGGRRFDEKDKSDDEVDEDELTPEERAARNAWREQQAVLQKLRAIAEDARVYEQDTGTHALHVGFPLLSLPPGSLANSRSSSSIGTKRVLAPVAFVPVSVLVKRGASQSVEIACKGEGTDRVMPNTALLAWLEQQTGKAAGDLFADDSGEAAWREICGLVAHVCKTLELSVPEVFVIPPRAEPPAGVAKTQASSPTVGEAAPTSTPAPGAPAVPEVPPEPEMPATFELRAAPKTEDVQGKAELICAAIIGLFPMANQGLLRDMQAMAAGESLAGPVQSFVQTGIDLDAPPPAPATGEGEAPAEPPPTEKRTRSFEDERLVTLADPCQARAVKLARECKGLVIHGPPGTGKSQTIANVIGDHLSRGQRVLMVCDKRTALDVVANRLEHMGLGRLCALVHDPQRDQRDLYRSIRDQLDELPETQSDARAEQRLAKINAELQSLHGALTKHHQSLMHADEATGLSFHDLVGQWLAIEPDPAVKLDEQKLAGATLADVESAEHDLHDVLQRSFDVEYATNLWRDAAGIALEDFLSRPMEPLRAVMSKMVERAEVCDATIHPNIPPFAATVDLATAGNARAELAERLSNVLQSTTADVRARWATQSADAIARGRKKLADAAPLMDLVKAGPLDVELAGVAPSSPPTVATIAQQLAALAAYLDAMKGWSAIFAFGKKSAARKVLNPYGLTLDAPSADRLKTFLTSLRARLLLQDVVNELAGQKLTSTALTDDESLEASLAAHQAVLDLLARVHTEPPLAGLAGLTGAALTSEPRAESFLDGLRRSPRRAVALSKLEDAMRSSGLTDAKWQAGIAARFRKGDPSVPVVAPLRDRLDTLEGVLRIRVGLTKMPASLKPAVNLLLAQHVEPKPAELAVRRAILAAEIVRRLRSDPALQDIDSQRMASSFERYRLLEQQKQIAVRETVLHRWTSKQRERLLATTGSRVNAAGADLKRRLLMRGERAMRLRQVVAVGQSIQGGDPLFDLRPVWMASPETVAQVFPRQPLFDVVVFDEASQCRLEEALPVLTRGHRVVIAGDPKQLPPTRFFESAVAQSDNEEIADEQQLFERQQGEVEDLLTAALNLSIEQCYLDVHYRSRNADLIEFSNEYFYGKRLQPIPGHPSNRTRYAPLTLYRANGVYKDGENRIEAESVCAIVRDLLKRADPPSIGIACFNIDQRDVIVERLDELAVEDPEFGKRLAAARTRTGDAAFEGLFVKNLENVQGDERDHMIISTTYGPDPNGKFYRRFGPLGRAGGGRRLNVLVTRAREEVHLVTSIPAAAYRALPPIPPGQIPGGGWLLFAYLKYAEQLADVYDTTHRVLEQAQADQQAQPASLASLASPAVPAPEPQVDDRPSRHPSPLARSLAAYLASHRRVGSTVHWGNEGFMIDLALQHPVRPEDVTLGVMCDSSRFAQAADPVEWDIFRTAIHESQGWTLHRLWSPHLFRDLNGCVKRITDEASALVAKEDPKESLRVERPTALEDEKPA